LPAPTALPALVDGAEGLAASARPHLEAPRAAIEAVAAAAALSFEEGCRRERALFFACARSEQAKALIHAFFAERAVSKVPGYPAEAATPVRTVGIVTAGANRYDIAAACANAGLRVIPDGAGPEALAAADVVIEAAFERLDLTRRRFVDLDRVASAGCLLATRASAVDLDLVAAATSRPERVVGLHFPYPADQTRLVEIVRGRHSSPQALASALAFAKRLGKVGVVVGNAAGLVGDRLMQRYVEEAQLVTAAGVAPQQVDRALTNFGMTRSLGAGENRMAMTHPDAGRFVDSRARNASGGHEALSDDAVVERLVLALVNEGARVVDEGVASRAADVDVICIAGYGFPAFRGGPMFYADRLGLEHVYARLAALHARHGPRWQPAPLLVRLSQRGRTFRQHDADAGAPTVTPPA
jgi:3-hydroxyacyl-CoA dehydrogenase